MRVADADRDRLLADRDVQEAGQLAGAEPLLDLLLEAPDQQHLAQEVAQPLLGQRSLRFPLDLRHSAEFMLSSVGVVDQWRAIRQGLPDRDADLRIANQWRAIEQRLPEGWGEARLRLTVPDDAEAARTAALLAPANATRRGTVVWIYVSRVGGGSVPDLVARLLARARYRGDTRAPRARGHDRGTQASRAAQAADPRRAWDARTRELPEDWSDLWRRSSSSRATTWSAAPLLLAPVNPARAGERLALPVPRRATVRLRRLARRCCAAASSGSTARARISGTLRILRALADTKPVSTQGPVWYVGGRVGLSSRTSRSPR